MQSIDMSKPYFIDHSQSNTLSNIHKYSVVASTTRRDHLIRYSVSLNVIKPNL